MYLTYRIAEDYLKNNNVDSYGGPIDGWADVHDVDAAKEEIKAFALDRTKAQKGENLFIWSQNNGTGKTHLAWLFLHARKGHTYDTAMIHFSDFLTLKHSMYPSAEEREELGTLRTVKTLLIDDVSFTDLGKEDVQYARRALKDILDWRLEHKFATVFTSNLSPTQLEDIFGASNYSRFLYRTTFVHLDTFDHRNPAFAKLMALQK
jgi:DNA replication protein DnaC